MRIITARIGEKTYTTGSISTGLAREIIRCMEDITAVGKSSLALGSDSGAADVVRVLRAQLDVATRETNLICRLFGNNITADDVENSLSRTERDRLITAAADAVGELASTQAYGASQAYGGTQTASQAMDKLYHTLATRLRWSIAQIDSSDFEALMRFVFFRDPDVRIIGGREYRRAQGVPQWL